ncbi:MFS transporter [Seongchinamella unica]|uniref:MFS transporter n=1 Tax=Seongchinamella unica TaxID=2547392 RepID=A0A4R5LTT2_9GAMM|nr:MFS transporter [Seongchinamella unica]TDG14167.1 MFS transporter [Seongchinamella unica]
MFQGWKVVGGGFTAQLFVVGFLTYAVSLLVTPVQAEFGVSLEQVMYSLTAATFLGLFMQPVAGAMIDRFSVRGIMIAGSVLYALGLYLTSIAQSIGQYIAAFALTMAIANALAGSMCSSAVISRWFVASRGRALGIAALGTSVGGVVIPALVSYWLGTDGWRGALENLAWCVLLLMMPVVALSVRDHPADLGLHPEGLAESPPEPTGTAPNQDMRGILRSPPFWYLGLALGLLFSAYSAVLSNISPYAINLGSSKEQASALIMAVAVTGFIGKILFGIAADRFSLKAALWTAQGLVAASFLVLAQEPGHGVMLLGTSLLGLAAGGMLPVWGAMMAQLFGLGSYGRAMGLMGPVITLCVMPGFAVIGRMYDSLGSYTPSLYFFAGVCAVSALLLAPLRLPARRD